MSAIDLQGRLAEAPAVSAAREALKTELPAWVVGGAVRDAALGERVVDADLAVEPGGEEAAARQIARAAGGYSFPLSEEHATWRAVAAGGKWHADVAALRAESIEADLRARDFTVNAVAIPLFGGEPVDPLGGLGDAEERRLRIVSERSFAEDPLRLMRAARIAASHGLQPETETVRRARAEAVRAADPAGERQFAELRGMLSGPAPLLALELLDDLGVTAVVLPELDALRGVVQNPNHHLDVHGHTLAVLENLLEIESDLEGFAGTEAGRTRELLDEPLADELDRRAALRFGALFHDLGKPATRGEMGGYVTFIGHDAEGARIVAGICDRLRTSRRLSHHLQALTLNHLRLGFLVGRRPLTRRQVYDYLQATEPVGADVTLLTVADRLSARGEGELASEEMIKAHLDLARELLADALDWHRQAPRPPLSGDELAAELGMPPGPRMGEVLEELRAASFAGEVGSRDDALALAGRLMAAGGG